MIVQLGSHKLQSQYDDILKISYTKIISVIYYDYTIHLGHLRIYNGLLKVDDGVNTLKIFINYDVNNLTNSDIEKLRVFLRDCWRATYLQQLGTNITEKMINTLNDDHLGGMLSAEDINVLVCFNDQDIVGTCMYASRYDTTYIWGVYVHTSEQASGIGRSLLSRVVDNISGSNVLQVIVLEASDNAVAFYKHLGFSIIQKIAYELMEGCNQPAFVMKVRADSLT